jgi:thymidylate kinase
MKIISLSGLDGSGKSTQVKMLQDYLESRGMRVFYFHAIQFGIANQINIFLKRVLFRRPSEDGAKPFHKKGVTQASGFQIWLRKIFLEIDIFRFKNLIMKLEKEGFDFIISDRYFYDNAVNIEYLSEKSFPNFKVRKPDAAFYLQTDPETIMQREKIPDQGIEYLKKKKEIFDKYARVWDLKIVDGNQFKDNVFESVKLAINALDEKLI